MLTWVTMWSKLSEIMTLSCLIKAVTEGLQRPLISAIGTHDIHSCRIGLVWSNKAKKIASDNHGILDMISRIKINRIKDEIDCFFYSTSYFPPYLVLFRYNYSNCQPC